MCGLAGIINSKESKDKNIMEGMFAWISVRGTDSSGVIGINNQNKCFIYKQPKASYLLINDKPYNMIKDTCNTILCHTRMMTKGHYSKNNNNHPVRYNDWIVNHNGYLYNWNSSNKYSKLKQHDVDSEYIPLIAHECNLDVNDYDSIDKFLKDLSTLTGVYAFTLVNMKQPRYVYIGVDTQEFTMIEHKETGTIYYASTFSVLCDELLGVSWNKQYINIQAAWQELSKEYNIVFSSELVKDEYKFMVYDTVDCQWVYNEPIPYKTAKHTCSYTCNNPAWSSYTQAKTKKQLHLTLDLPIIINGVKIYDLNEFDIKEMFEFDLKPSEVLGIDEDDEDYEKIPIINITEDEYTESEIVNDLDPLWDDPYKSYIG